MAIAKAAVVKELRLCWQGVMAAMQSLNEVLAHFGRLLATSAPHVLDPSTCLGLEQGLPYLAVSREVFTGVLTSCDASAFIQHWRLERPMSWLHA